MATIGMKFLLFFSEGWPYLRSGFVLHLGLSEVVFIERGVLTSGVAFMRGSTVLCWLGCLMCIYNNALYC